MRPGEPRITRPHLLRSWRRALDAAEAACEAARAGEAITLGEHVDMKRRLRGERELLDRFEHESAIGVYGRARRP